MSRSSLPADRAFRYPVYRVQTIWSADLGQFAGAAPRGAGGSRIARPYYSRAEIEAGALAEHGYEIAWLDDPVDVLPASYLGSAIAIRGRRPAESATAAQ
jgi:membrane-bound lytic murein transglycosylase